MKGVPQILTAYTTASADDVLAVINGRAPKCYVGDLLHRVLLQWESAAVCLFLPLTGRMIASTDGTVAYSILGAWESASSPRLMLRPRSGQYGASMLWEVVSDTLGETELSDLLGNAYQKRTFYGLVNTAVAFYQKRLMPPMVLVDQINGVIGLSLHFDEAETAVDAIVPAGETIGVRFEPAKSKIVFE